MEFAPQLSTSGTTASVVGSGTVSGVMLGEFPPSFGVLTASFARLAVIVVIHVMTLAATKRTRRWTQQRPGGSWLFIHSVLAGLGESPWTFGLSDSPRSALASVHCQPSQNPAIAQSPPKVGSKIAKSAPHKSAGIPQIEIRTRRWRGTLRAAVLVRVFIALFRPSRPSSHRYADCSS